MFLTQPPICCLTLHSDPERSITWAGEREVTRNFTYESGITINDFICQCEEMLRTCCTGLDLHSSVYLFKKFDRYEQLEGWIKIEANGAIKGEEEVDAMLR